MMKTSLLLAGVLLVGAPAFSQVAPAPATQTAPAQSGYESLVEAGAKILPGPNGGASNTDPKISPEENLKRERLAVARNAPALALVRLALALQQPVVVPPLRFEGDLSDDFKFNAGMRELARQFSQESDVRLADGDFAGAMNSRLDAMELGAVTGHGVLISMLVGVAIESIGLKDADKFAAHLGAVQCREAAARLKTIEARRTTLAQTLREEQRFALRSTLANFGNFKGMAEPKPAEDGTFPTAQDIAGFKALTPETLTRNSARLFDAVVEAAALPPSRAKNFPLPQDLDLFTKTSLALVEGGRYRFGFDRTVAQSRLVRAALELRAAKLEAGAYPTDFTALIDPFSPDSKPLVYKKTARDYLLYSVGPDGKDDDGAEIQTIFTDEQTGAKTVRDKLAFDSTGDIVQDPF